MCEPIDRGLNGCRTQMTQIERRRTQILILLLIVLLAFGVRVFRLDAQSLWYDEGVTAYISGLDLRALTGWTAADIQPPLYYILMAGWRSLAGVSEWSLRFVSVFFGTLTVPLMAALTVRLTRSRRAGLLAALFTALHPLLIYYSQEARMYALLVALGVLIGYLVARLAEGEGRAWLWVGYVLAAVAAIYTHYFAFFLLAALALAYLLDVWRGVGDEGGHSRTRRIVTFLGANLIVLLLYLPWFAVLFRRLAVDRSYWQGHFKVGEALVDIAISFTSGETVMEEQGLWLLLLYTAVTLIALIGLARGGPRSRRALRYGLLWLIIPVAAVLTLASFAPKFNPRYVMIALPGLLVIWGAGLGNWELKIEDSRLDSENSAAPLSSRHPVTLSSPHLVTLSALLLLLGFTYATVNWFANPAFTKDDWRGVTEFLRPRLKETEGIALISGHAWPVWDYYAPDLPALRLPDLRILDVDAVLDFADTVQPLRDALDPLSDRPGIWLVEWQEEVVDPTGVVPVQLLIAGKEKGLDTHYWGLKLRRFSQLKTHWIPDAPPIKTPMDVTFGDQLVLRGFNAIDSGDLLLFWQRAPGYHPDATNYVVAGEVYDQAGHLLRRLPDQRPAGYDYPAERWPDERVAMGVFAAKDWLGDDPQPGTYTVRLRVYDDREGERVLLTTGNGRDEVELNPVDVVLE